MLARLVPAPLVRLFARPYVAGESMEAGLALARSLLQDRMILSTLDLLGEGVGDTAEVLENERIYERLIDAIASDAAFQKCGYQPWGFAGPTVSIKPSAFAVDAMEAAAAPITRLCERAARNGVPITIDMEDHRFTDFTLDLAVGLFERGLDVGTVLQTRLHRTAADLARIPAGMRLRLVIGIYPEPLDIAVADKGVMKARMLEQAGILLDQGAKVEFATHDEPCLERFLREIAPKAPDRCELQLLLGVPREGFLRRMRALEFGEMPPVRIYVPFAVGWDNAMAYLRRRMVESPSMIWLVLRNLLPERG